MSPSRPPSAHIWVDGARPRTLPASVVPVAVGVAVVRSAGAIRWGEALLALVVSLAIQIGTNYANDYSDGVRGTDKARVGPPRLVGGGLAPARSVRRAAFAAYGVAMLAGLWLAILTSPWLIVVGAVSIAAGWFYTGGPHPYGYAGFGELFVFVFFGLVAVLGTVYVCSGKVPAFGVLAAVPVGLLAVALLVVNNLRDIPGDAVSGKHTLAVRIGPGRTRALYAGCVLVALALVIPIAAHRAVALIALLAIVFALGPIRRVLSRATGRDLVPALIMTGRLQMIFGLLLAVGIAW